MTTRTLVGIAATGLLFAAASPKNVLTGEKAFASFSDVKAGTWRHITAADLPKPFATSSSSNGARVVPRPANAWPVAPAGFKVGLYATGLQNPRLIRRAPNGDLFMAETTGRGSIKIFRGMTADGKPVETSVFAEGLNDPFGIAFWPPAEPKFVYIGNTTSVVRFPYRNGDLLAAGPAEVVIPSLPNGGHTTRDVAFSADGKRMFVAIGSGSNVSDDEREFHRANVLEYTPEGKFVKVYGAGIRNPVGLAVNPITGELWCSVNERDELGDNLVPDYITHIQEGASTAGPGITWAAIRTRAMKANTPN
jgi:glucose/arabinose dehydrogenase